MDFSSVQAQINDVPATFQRASPAYQQLLDSLSGALATWTAADDGLAKQITFQYATDGWLDCWGLLYGVSRHQNEANDAYYARIQETLLAWVGTLPALQAWVTLFAFGGFVTESLPTLGFTVVLPSNMTTTQIQSFITTLNRIRPAGVPFMVEQITDGLFVYTVNFVGEGRMPGSYLSSSVLVYQIVLPSTTNNAQPLLPDLYFTDPTLNV